MANRRTRIGVNLLGTRPMKEVVEQIKQAEEIGVDVVMVPDHLGLAAPFPTLAAAALITSRVRLGTYVLNTGFYRPALLARDIAGVDALSRGRLEIGLGAGYVAEEFEAVGLPFPSPGARVRHLSDTVTELRSLLSDPSHVPAPTQIPPPFMIAGGGDKVLTLAAEQADIVALTGIDSLDVLDQRLKFVAQKANQRFEALEFNLIVFELALDRTPDVSALRGFRPTATDEELALSPHVQAGSLDEIVNSIRTLNAHGVSYVTFIEPDLDDVAKIIRALDDHS